MMTELQLDEIEHGVGFPLPAAYRRVAMEFPFRPIGRDCIYWFHDDPAAVISDTLAPLSNSDYSRSGWRNGWLVIGHSAAGDLHILDTRAEGLPVHYLSHETHEVEPGWPTFDAFVAEWGQTPAKVERQLAADAEIATRMGRQQLRLALLIIAASIGLPLAGLLFIWVVR
jgi:hypothetical protein